MHNRNQIEDDRFGAAVGGMARWQLRGWILAGLVVLAWAGTRPAIAAYTPNVTARERARCVGAGRDQTE